MIRTALSSAAALVAAGVAFVVLYPILGVALWVSLIATGVVLVGVFAGAYASLPTGETGDAITLNPIVDVTVLRARYFATLALALVAGFTIVEVFAFGGGARQSIGFALGIGVAAAAGAGFVMSLARRGPKQHVTAASRLRLPVWDVLALVTATVGGWQIVQTLVFSNGTSTWLTFANGCLLLTLALAGLVLHELSTERVVHALEVVGSAIDREEAGNEADAPIHASAA